ncbi:MULTISPECIES: hypothetical protein [Amycolatopsis]|uniref:Uncharacterized protein n=1 Tax=Amycolatopsis bullii TaxID=941987 RepID=A0ABQ3KF95_9PSEU|nr:hypothetical protein [Amycolatopsis bullii]GHG14135.1 hypothetical protein GCM10017567_34760 [Amycolatopsis bullii]
MYFDLSPFSDPSSGHYGQSVADLAETVLYRGDERIGGQPWTGYHEFDVPPGESRYRLHSESARSSSAGLSTKVTADWTFRSGTVPRAQVRPIPMMAVPPGPAFVSLRATATDGAGNTVDQTIIRGYRLR